MHEKGFVNVDAELRTNVAHVWAVGDVAATPLQLAHVAFTEGYAVAERIAGSSVADIDYVEHPEGHLLHARDRERRAHRGPGARARAWIVVTEKLDFRAIGKANIVGEGGFVKVVAEAGDGPSAGST